MWGWSGSIGRGSKKGFSPQYYALGKERSEHPERPLRPRRRSGVGRFKLEDKPATQLELSRIVCRAGVGVKLV